MTTTELHKKLREAYSNENLHNITLTLINLYKNEQYLILRKIADIIRETVTIEIADDGKGFSKFMMLYHPDRSGFHLNEINRLAAQNNLEGLKKYRHILKLAEINEIADSLGEFEDIDYSPVYEWNFETGGFRYFYDNEPERKIKTKRCFVNFYDAYKKRIFESTDFEYPSYYLEDLDEFELSSSDINDLDGIEYCIHARIMDLSDNSISFLNPLFHLTLLEELNLADNKIDNIDILGNLTNLKTVILSNNNLEDISPLFDLPRLEYADLSGNQIKPGQIEKLLELGITVEI